MQSELLEMFSSRKMIKEERQDIKLPIANYYAQKADEAIDRLFEEKGWDVQEKVKEWEKVITAEKVNHDIGHCKSIF